MLWFYKLFSKFLLRCWAALLTRIGIIAYVLLPGGEPPVLRAAFIGALALAKGLKKLNDIMGYGVLINRA